MDMRYDSITFKNEGAHNLMVLSLKRKKNSATLDNFDGSRNKCYTAGRSQIGHRGSLQWDCRWFSLY